MTVVYFIPGEKFPLSLLSEEQKWGAVRRLGKVNIKLSMYENAVRTHLNVYANWKR